MLSLFSYAVFVCVLTDMFWLPLCPRGARNEKESAPPIIKDPTIADTLCMGALPVALTACSALMLATESRLWLHDTMLIGGRYDLTAYAMSVVAFLLAIIYCQFSRLARDAYAFFVLALANLFPVVLCGCYVILWVVWTMFEDMGFGNFVDHKVDIPPHNVLICMAIGAASAFLRIGITFVLNYVAGQRRRSAGADPGDQDVCCAERV